MDMASAAVYVPGVCNIGLVEMRRRRQGGWMGLAVTALLWAGFIVLAVPSPWRLILFLPAATGATGFFQAAFHFCAGFGMKGVFNFGAELGRTESVQQAEFRRQDRRKALLIVLYSALAGLAVALAALFIAPTA